MTQTSGPLTICPNGERNHERRELIQAMTISMVLQHHAIRMTKLSENGEILREGTEWFHKTLSSIAGAIPKTANRLR
jgi:hypothetical protein